MEAQPESDPQSSHPENPKPAYEEIEEDEDLEPEEEEEEEDNDPTMSTDARIQRDRANMNSLFQRLTTERVPARVHDIIIEGNKKTKDSLIEAEVEPLFRGANSFQELLRAAAIARVHLHGLGIFDSVVITLDAGPPELPGTANVVIDVSEGRLLSGDFGVFSKPEVFLLDYWRLL